MGNTAHCTNDLASPQLLRGIYLSGGLAVASICVNLC